MALLVDSLMCAANPLLGGQERQVGIVCRPCRRCGRVVEGGIFVRRDVTRAGEEGNQPILTLELDTMKERRRKPLREGQQGGRAGRRRGRESRSPRSASQKW